MWNPQALDTASAEGAFEFVFDRGNALLQHALLGCVSLPVSGPWLHLADLFPGTPAQVSLTGVAGALPEVNPLAEITLNLRPADRETLLSGMAWALYHAEGGQVSRDYGGTSGTLHEGIDFTRGAGSPVYAPVTGRLLRAETQSSGLSVVAIYDMAQNMTVFCLHLNPDASLRPGQMVQKGARLGTEGSHGTTSAHTHLEAVPGLSWYPRLSDGYQNNPAPYDYWEQVILRGAGEPSRKAPPSPHACRPPRWRETPSTSGTASS